MKDDLGAGYISMGQERVGGQYVTMLEIGVIQSQPPIVYSYTYLHDSLDETITALDHLGSSQTFVRANFQISDIQSNVTSEFPKISITAALLPNSPTGAFVKGQSGLRGCPVYIIRTFKDFIGTADESTCREVASLVIDSATITDTQLSLGLASKLEVSGITLPRRIFYRDFCARKYSALATYGSAMMLDFYCNQPDDTVTGCKRMLSSCRLRPGGGSVGGFGYRGYEKYFGGFPFIPRDRIRL